LCDSLGPKKKLSNEEEHHPQVPGKFILFFYI
jgi:hypothetical protein